MPVPILNRSSRYAQGIVFCVTQGHPTELVQGLAGTKLGSAGVGSSRWGRVFETFATTGQGWWWPLGSYIKTIKTAWTVMIFSDYDSGAASDARIVSIVAPGISPPIVWQVDSDPGGITGSTGRWQFSDTSYRSATYAGSYDWRVENAKTWWLTGNTAGTYIDGVYADNTSSPGDGSAVNFSDSTHITILNHSNSSTTLGVDGRSGMVAIWNRKLEPSEIVMLSKNPDLLLGNPYQFAPYPITSSAPAAGTNDPPESLIHQTQFNVHRM